MPSNFDNVCKSISIRWFFKWFYERGRSIDKTYAIKSNNFDCEITKDRDWFFLGKSGDFQQIANKLDFILKSEHSDTFAQNIIIIIFINIYFMQNEKVAS